MSHFSAVVASILIAALSLPCVANPRRDPLNPNEVDQLREASQDPPKRLKLYVAFARARMTEIEQLRSDPRLAVDRGPKTHDLMQEFGELIDEMDNNIDMYADRKADLRKPLKEVIEADSEFQMKLRTIKESLNDAAFANESKDYQFVVNDAVEAVDMSLDNARKLLEEQNVQFAKKK
jgi:regulator of replication initiation timing